MFNQSNARMPKGWKWGIAALFLIVALSTLPFGNNNAPRPPASDNIPPQATLGGAEVASAATSATASIASASSGAISGATSSPDPVIGGIWEAWQTDEPSGVEASAGEGSTERRPTDTGWAGTAARLFGGLALVLGILVALVYVAKRIAFGKQGDLNSAHLKVVSKTWLSNKSTLYLVRVPGKTLVVGEGPQGVNTLSEILDEELSEALDLDSADGGPEADGAAPGTPMKPKRLSPNAPFQAALRQAQEETEEQDLAGRVRESVAYFRDLTRKMRQGQ